MKLKISLYNESAVYDKLNRLEPCVSQALVRYSALQMANQIYQMEGQLPAVLPKYRLKILDGNRHLQKTLFLNDTIRVSALFLAIIGDV